MPKSMAVGNILMGDPLMGTSNAGEIGKNHNSRRNIWLSDWWLEECNQQ